MDSVFVIAEAGVNHGGDVAAAQELIWAAAEAGANAVKFQTFAADRLVTPNAAKAAYQQKATGAGESQHAMLQKLELSEADHFTLRDEAVECGLEFLSSPFDEISADFLERLGVARFKVGSGEITNLRFLRHLACKGLPVILSTGMSNLGEVEAAVEALAGCEVTLLHCVSNYPACPADVNLRAMETMRIAFGLPVGYSDHTIGPAIALAAVALGAVMIEKHLTLDRRMKGPDHQASMETADFRAMVLAMSDVTQALGNGRKRPAASEAGIAAVARKSVVTTRAVLAGETLTADSLAVKRPGTGLPPSCLDGIPGRRARADIAAGTPLTWDLLA